MNTSSAVRTDRTADRLQELLSQVLGVSPTDFTEDASPDSIPAWDSLNHLNITLALEQVFAVRLSAEEVLGMRNVALIRQTLRRHGAAI